MRTTKIKQKQKAEYRPFYHLIEQLGIAKLLVNSAG